ncbi:ATP-binding protein [Necropsobacter massiliensis]|uniref:ATP-binding protein n=1 Tax=Necropsobacter massiliensis TaxID=1400001 RepID=UPI0005960AAE|nr:ATP-binding protein [Necropsobacter massiliensis]
MFSHSIIKTLKTVFSLGLFVIILIAILNLIAWQQQREQVNYIINDYFPSMNQALKLENDINVLINDINNFSQLKNYIIRQQNFKKINLKIENIENSLLPYLKDEVYFSLNNNLLNLRELIENINNYLIEENLIEQKRQELITKTQWLNDDFNNEMFLLIKDNHWQQTNLSNLKEDETHQLLKKLHLDLQEVYLLSKYKEQIKNEINLTLNEINTHNILNQYNSLINQVNIISPYYYTKDHRSNNILLQITESFISMATENNTLHQLIKRSISNSEYYKKIQTQKDNLSKNTQDRLSQILNNTKNRFNQLNTELYNKIEISGVIILILLISSLLALFSFNYFYLYKNLANRFRIIINTIEDLNMGKLDIKLNKIGNDEIGKIAHLLQTYVKLNYEKILIEKDLNQTQEELIQTAKLAVVGQTMTTLAHEINQPLNAISIYIFSLKKLLSSVGISQAKQYISKIESLTERINQLIQNLRHFTKKSEYIEFERNVNLHNVINDSWNLLYLKHEKLKAEISISGNAMISTNRILLEQIFINLMSNSFEACSNIRPIIYIEIKEEKDYFYIYFHDNGIGWKTSEKLLQPFYTTKLVGLGLGLTICQRIMRQFKGNLFIASTLTQNAMIVLQYPKGNLC